MCAESMQKAIPHLSGSFAAQSMNSTHQKSNPDRSLLPLLESPHFNVLPN